MRVKGKWSWNQGIFNLPMCYLLWTYFPFSFQFLGEAICLQTIFILIQPHFLTKPKHYPILYSIIHQAQDRGPLLWPHLFSLLMCILFSDCPHPPTRVPPPLTRSPMPWLQSPNPQQTYFLLLISVQPIQSLHCELSWPSSPIIHFRYQFQFSHF